MVFLHLLFLLFSFCSKNRFSCSFDKYAIFEVFVAYTRPFTYTSNHTQLGSVADINRIMFSKVCPVRPRYWNRLSRYTRKGFIHVLSIVLFKTDNRRLKSNYRSVSLLPSFSKNCNKNGFRTFIWSFDWNRFSSDIFSQVLGMAIS